MNNILVKDLFKNKIVLGNIRTDGIIEYTVYKPVKSGIIDSDNSDTGSTIAAETDIVQYMDYELKMID